MAQSYDITIQLTIKGVRVEEGYARKEQVAKAICRSLWEPGYKGSPMDLFGLSHARTVNEALDDAEVDAEIGFYGNVTCKVVNPSKSGRQCNPGVRSLVSRALK